MILLMKDNQAFRENSIQLLLIGYYLLHCIFSQHPYYIIHPIYPTSLLYHSAYLSIALTAILFIRVMIFITVACLHY